MERKNNEQKTAQILYITIIMILLIMAITVGLVTAANKIKNPTVTEVTTEVSTTAKAVTARPDVTSKVPESTTAATTKVPRQEITTTAKTELTTKIKPTVKEDEPIPFPTFIMPTKGNISSEFSIDALVYSNTMEDYRTHNGIDISASFGSPVSAAADGIVTDVYEHPMMGYTVVISHECDAKTVYQNLDDEVTVSVGDTVKSGDIIGAVGESAIIEIAEEPHLHFEMCIADNRVNPLEYIDKSQSVISYEE